MNQTLNAIELDLIFYIERYHAAYGSTPSDDKLRQRFDDLTDDFMADFKINPLVIKSFRARGIIYPPAEDSFTADQMHAAAAMTDLVDRRSEEKKLRDLGITTRQWATWMQDDQFSDYIRNRSEKMLANTGVTEAHKALLKGARNGNVNSAKLIYEITGRHDPTKEAQVDVRRILYTFIEILQRHIKDPALLNSIAMDLTQIASAESLSTSLSNQIVNQPRATQPSLPPPPSFGD
jgi:hypothetical protein